MIEFIINYAIGLFIATIGLRLFWIVVANVADKYGKDSKNPLVRILYLVFITIDIIFNFIYCSVWYLKTFSLERLTIPNSDINPESPITTSLMTALRDNPCGMGLGKK